MKYEINLDSDPQENFYRADALSIKDKTKNGRLTLEGKIPNRLFSSSIATNNYHFFIFLCHSALFMNVIPFHLIL